MAISRDEALGLLRKWANESTQVFVLIVGEGIAFRLSGFISDLSPLVVLVAQRGQALRQTEVAIGLSEASGFDYSEVRQAPEPLKESMGDWITAGLAFNLPTAKINVYELLDQRTNEP
jgi:hypothetical protein